MNPSKRILTLGLAVLLGSGTLGAGTASDGSTCHPTGTGLTAKVVNQNVTGGTIDVGDCDVGAFFDQDGMVKNATFVQPDNNPTPRVQYAVRVEGANVNVTDSTFTVTPDYVNQIVDIGLLGGASGTIAGNTLKGFKRAGILLDGDGTSGTVRNNDVTGVGPKDSGWAENGIQVSGGANGTVVDNRVTDHWWDENNFVSSGIIVFGSDDVTVDRNLVKNNDAGVLLFGDRNNALHNTIEVTREEAATAIDTSHFGILVSGDNNGVRQNSISAVDGEVGIFVFGGSFNTKIIRNDISGWTTSVVDSGDETKRPAPFAD